MIHTFRVGHSNLSTNSHCKLKSNSRDKCSEPQRLDAVAGKDIAPQAKIHRNYTDYGAAGENFGGFVHYSNVSRDKNDAFS